MKLKPFTVTTTRHLKGLECLRCGHRWVPRISTAEVRICPKCKSAWWNKAKTATK